MDFAQQAVEKMLAYGADQADALVSESLSIGASSRLGNMEDIEHAGVLQMLVCAPSSEPNKHLYLPLA
jgi:predicted Zn-dependent protease